MTDEELLRLALIIDLIRTDPTEITNRQSVADLLEKVRVDFIEQREEIKRLNDELGQANYRVHTMVERALGEIK